MMYRVNPSHRQASQRGAALVVSLIMLLLLTLLGVAGMKDTLLQQKMVANTRDREVALQAAESALRAAETFLSGIKAPTMTNTAGLYDVKTSTVTNRTTKEAAFWQNWAWNTNAVAYNKTLDGVLAGNPPRYVIEQLPVELSSRSGYPGAGCSGVCAEDAFEVTEAKDVSDYRITVRAVGSTLDAVVLLQSTFRRDSQ